MKERAIYRTNSAGHVSKGFPQKRNLAPRIRKKNSKTRKPYYKRPSIYKLVLNVSKYSFKT